MIHVSAHAAKRWTERTEPGAVEPKTAWVTGVRVRDAEDVVDADECRYHRETETILVRRDTTIVTILLAYADERLAAAVGDLDDARADGGPDVCPACGRPPGEIYRCQHCGRDLVEETDKNSGPRRLR